MVDTISAEEIKNLASVAKEYLTFRESCTNGLLTLIDGEIESARLRESNAPLDNFTIADWLEDRGINLSFKQKYNLSFMAATLYKNKYGNSPPKTITLSNYTSSGCYIYSSLDEHLLHLALETTLHMTGGKYSDIQGMSAMHYLDICAMIGLDVSSHNFKALILQIISQGILTGKIPDYIRYTRTFFYPTEGLKNFLSQSLGHRRLR